MNMDNGGLKLQRGILLRFVDEAMDGITETFFSLSFHRWSIFPPGITTYP